MAKIDQSYHNLCKKILSDGRKYEDPNRKNVYRVQIPYYSFVHDFKNGFPAITTKKLYWKGVVGELLWFLRGDTNIKYLVDNDINIWNKDAYNYYNGPESFNAFIFNIKNNITKNGDLGRIYGAQWRRFRNKKSTFGNTELYGVDQISNLIKNLKEKPLATNHIVTSWNPAELNDMALPPCHKGFQIMVYPLLETHTGHILDLSKDSFGEHNKVWEGPKYGFDLVWEQRSVDTFLGLPFNIASYSLLAYIIGKMVNMIPGKIYGDLRNVHIYENHLDAVNKQLNRDINKHGKSYLELPNNTHWNLSIDELLDDLKIKDCQLRNYQSYDRIPAEMLAYNK